MKNTGPLLFILLLTPFFLNAGFIKNKYSFHSIYLYNFVKYIQWPNLNDELVIGVSGGSQEVMEAMEKMAALKSTPALKLSVRKVQSPGEVEECHILFVPEEESGKVGIYAARANRNVLVVTEGEGMLQKGGMINFLLVDKKLRFEISQQAVDQTRLKISSQLMVMAVQR